jgi:transcriptional regulator with XRE-family HTH domain
MTQNEKVSETLKKFFSNMGLSQRAIADKVGCSQQVVQALLNGRPFGRKTAEKWSTLFGLNPAWLITGEGVMLLSEKEAQPSLAQPTASLIVGEAAEAISKEILRLVANGELYTANAMEEVRQQLKEKELEVQRLNREIGALEAQLERLGQNTQKSVNVG